MRLRTDIDIVTRLARSIDTNLDGIQDVMDGGRGILQGFLGAYNPDLRAINLRNNFGPLVTEALGPLFDSVGLPIPCVPVDAVCPEGGLGVLDGGAAAVDAELAVPTTPVTDILELLGMPTAVSAPTDQAVPEHADRSIRSRFFGTFFGVGG